MGKKLSKNPNKCTLSKKIQFYQLTSTGSELLELLRIRILFTIHLMIWVHAANKNKKKRTYIGSKQKVCTVYCRSIWLLRKRELNVLFRFKQLQTVLLKSSAKEWNPFSKYTENVNINISSFIFIFNLLQMKLRFCF